MFKPGRVVFITLATLANCVLSVTAGAEDAMSNFEPFAHEVPLNPTAAGSFTVTGTLAGVEGDFLLDTGASMITVSSEFFEQMDARNSLVPARRMAARLASGRVEAVDVYRIETLQIGGNCLVGPVDVAVMPRGGRNLLGMSVLMQAAPFAVSVSPPALSLSRCGLEPSVATR